MTYTFDRQRTVQQNLRHIGRSQLEGGLAVLDDPALDIHERIHEVRKTCKKVRALVRLTRGSAEDLYERENAALRDAARLVAGARDLTANLEAMGLLQARFGGTVEPRLFALGRQALEARRLEVLPELDLEAKLAEVGDALEGVLERCRTWSLGDTGFDALREGLGKTYKHAVHAMHEALDEPTSERWHEWRKWVKYHRYHTDLLEEMWEPVLEEREAELHELTDRLGDDHNLFVLRRRFQDHPDWIDPEEGAAVLIGLVDRLRADLQQSAASLGRRVFAETPDALVERYGRYWIAWHSEVEGEGTSLADPVIPPGR